MNAELPVCASSTTVADWEQVNWKQCERQVRRLQARIVKASQMKRWGKVKALQRLLVCSFSGKALAVKRDGRIRGVACWAHVRRKFYDLPQVYGSPIAKEALQRILHAIEAEIRGRPPDERRAVRQARARPLLNSLHDWLETSLTRLSRKSDTTAGCPTHTR